jgi:hypothetical protein
VVLSICSGQRGVLRMFKVHGGVKYGVCIGMKKTFGFYSSVHMSLNIQCVIRVI